MGSDRMVGFVGVGVMGRPMARRLLDAGYHVVIHNRSLEPVDALVRQGARAAGSLADVAACPRVITMLPDGDAISTVVLGPDGLVNLAERGSLIIDMGTSGPPTARAVARACADAGLRALDAPISGGEEGAQAGSLSIMVGGDADDVAAARDLFDVLGSTVVHVGPAGAGQVVKAANQILVGGIIASLSEALLVIERNGIDAATAQRVLAAGLAGNRLLELRGKRMAARQFPAGARAALHRKDLGYALEEARQLGVFTPITALVEQLFTGLVSTGRGHLDHTSILALLDELTEEHPPDYLRAGHV